MALGPGPLFFELASLLLPRTLTPSPTPGPLRLRYGDVVTTSVSLCSNTLPQTYTCEVGFTPTQTFVVLRCWRYKASTFFSCHHVGICFRAGLFSPLDDTHHTLSTLAESIRGVCTYWFLFWTPFLDCSYTYPIVTPLPPPPPLLFRSWGASSRWRACAMPGHLEGRSTWMGASTPSRTVCVGWAW